MNLKKSQNDIIKFGLGVNFIFLIISFFNHSLLAFNLLLIINIILLGSYLIISKYFLIFQGLLTANKFANKLNEKLGELHGEISREV